MSLSFPSANLHPPWSPWLLYLGRWGASGGGADGCWGGTLGLGGSTPLCPEDKGESACLCGRCLASPPQPGCVPGNSLCPARATAGRSPGAVLRHCPAAALVRGTGAQLRLLCSLHCSFQGVTPGTPAPSGSRDKRVLWDPTVGSAFEVACCSGWAGEAENAQHHWPCQGNQDTSAVLQAPASDPVLGGPQPQGPGLASGFAKVKRQGVVASQWGAQLHLHCDRAQPPARGPGPHAARRRCRPDSVAFLARHHVRARHIHSQPTPLYS